MNNEIITPDDLDPSATMQVKIVEVLKSADRPMKPAQIAEALGENKGNVQGALGRMKADGLVNKPRYGFYVLAKKSEAQSILYPIQEKSHTPASQSDIGLSPRGDYSEGDKSQPQTTEDDVEIPRRGGVMLNVPQFIDVWMWGELIATVEFAQIMKGMRKNVDITKEAMAMRYSSRHESPHNSGTPEHEKSPPGNG